MEYMRTTAKKMMDFLVNFFRTTTIPMDIVFKIIAGPDTEEKLVKQKAVLLEVASQYTEDEKAFQEILDKYQDKYLRLDNYHSNIRKRHPKYQEARAKIVNLYEYRARADARILQGTGKNYYEMVRSILSKEEATDVIEKEIVLVEDLVNFILKNRSLVNVPGIIRADVIDALVASANNATSTLREELTVIFP